MSWRNKLPHAVLIGVMTASTTALAGVGLGRYTISGVNPLYMDTYRAYASYRAKPPKLATGEAFWDRQAELVDVAYRPPADNLDSLASRTSY